MFETSLLQGYVIQASGAIHDIQSPLDLPGVIQQMAQRFAVVASQVLGTINSIIVDVARLSYVTALLLGAVLYWSHLERRLGKDLIKLGLLLAILSEFVFPVIVKV